jgi:hypothetical protein
MGRRTVEIFICDVCGRTIKEGEWTRLHYPTLVHYLNEYGTETGKEVRMLELDACESCLDKMAVLETVSGYGQESKPRWRNEASE